MKHTGQRLPRFRRAADAVGQMILTDRDRQIIERVGRLRMASSTQILRLIGGAKVQLLRRLRLLYHHGWLDRPRCQLDYYHRGGGSSPMAYCLGKRGALFMRELHGSPPGGGKWEGNGAAVGRVFLNHTLSVSEILVEAEIACRESAGEMIHIPPESLLEASTAEPLLRPNPYDHRRRSKLVPDAVFGVKFTALPVNRQLMIFCVEADRGTMPIIRRAQGRSSIGNKLERYSLLWKRGDFKKIFGTGRLVVAIVTTSHERRLNILRAAAGLPYGRGIFECCTSAELAGDFPRFLRQMRDRRRGEEALETKVSFIRP